MANKRETPNYELYIRETLSCIVYLLKHTDQHKYASLTEIVDFMDKEYSLETKRQRIAKELNTLVDYDFITEKLGFIVDSIQPGKSNKYLKYFISKRLLTMKDINDIDDALRNYASSGCTRMDEIINGLTTIFPTVDDINTSLQRGDCCIESTKTAKQSSIALKVNKAFVHKIKCEYTLYNDKALYEGHVCRIYNTGDGDYDIEFFDGELRESKMVRLSNIKDIILISNTKVNSSALTSIAGNLSLDARDISGVKFNKFMTNNKDLHENFVTLTDKTEKPEDLTKIGFTYTTPEIIKSFNKEFGQDLVEETYAFNHENNMRFRHKDNEPLITRVEVRVSKSQFINWATRNENLLNIHDISPLSIEKEIQNQYVITSNLLLNKYQNTYKTNENGFDIHININDEVEIVKINSNAEEIVIPDEINGMKVTAICEKAAFNRCFMKKLILGNNIKEIKDSAFNACISLKEIVFNDHLEVIGEHAFEGCDIETINIKGHIRNIKHKAFAKNDLLREVNIFNPTIETLRLGSYAFAHCRQLHFVDIACVEQIEDNCFTKCRTLRKVYLRCTPYIHVDGEFIDNPDTEIIITFNKHRPSVNPFADLDCADQISFDDDRDGFEG